MEREHVKHAAFYPKNSILPLLLPLPSQRGSFAKAVIAGSGTLRSCWFADFVSSSVEPFDLSYNQLRLTARRIVKVYGHRLQKVYMVCFGNSRILNIEYKIL